MESSFLFASAVNLVINLLYTIAALFTGVVALNIIDKKLFKDIDFQKEMKNGNTAVAVFASTILIFVALIVSFGFRS